MDQRLLRIHIYVEGTCHNEDFYHAVEHRFFEHAALSEFENDKHTFITAHAHVTGIIFQVRTVRHSAEDVMKMFDVVLSGEIPEFSQTEKRRFEQENRERAFDRTQSFVESCPFREELEFPACESSVRHFSEFVVRTSVVVEEEGKFRYFETRYRDSVPHPVLTSSDEVVGSGKEFHLVVFHEIRGIEDAFYKGIYAEYLRKHLKARYSEKGKAYTIWASAYFEAGYAYYGYYWHSDREHEFAFRNSDLRFDLESFEHHKEVLLFDTLVTRSDHENSFYAILGIDPNQELEAIANLTYEGFLGFIKNSGGVNRLYSR